MASKEMPPWRRPQPLPEPPRCKGPYGAKTGAEGAAKASNGPVPAKEAAKAVGVVYQRSDLLPLGRKFEEDWYWFNFAKLAPRPERPSSSTTSEAAKVLTELQAEWCDDGTVRSKRAMWKLARADRTSGPRTRKKGGRNLEYWTKVFKKGSVRVCIYIYIHI